MRKLSSENFTTRDGQKSKIKTYLGFEGGDRHMVGQQGPRRQTGEIKEATFNTWRIARLGNQQANALQEMEVNHGRRMSMRRWRTKPITNSPMIMHVLMVRLITRGAQEVDKAKREGHQIWWGWVGFQ